MKQVTTFVFILVIIFPSCISEDFSIGSNLTSVEGRTVLLEDYSVSLETHLSDSTVTNDLSKVFEGRYISSDFGVIAAHSYIDFDPPSYSTVDFGSSAINEVRFDSITLILKYDSYSYGDTTKLQTMNIYRLQESIVADESDQLYTTSSFRVEKNPWVTKRFLRPNEHFENDSTLEVRLPDEFGLDLIDLMDSQSDLLGSYENFNTYFKGFKISPSADDDAVVNSFVIDEDYPIIRIYYSTIGSSTEEGKTVDLNVNTSVAFSQIETDRSGTPLEALDYRNTSLSSSETGNKVFLQGLTGLYAKLTFPDLNEILKLGDYVIISSATLYVRPVLGSYSSFTPLPESMSLNYLNEEGKPSDIYVDASTTTVQSGELVEDMIYNKNTYYAFDVTSYIQYEVGLSGMYKSALQLSLEDTDFSTSLKSLVLGDQSFSNEDNRIFLTIYAIIYDND